MWYFSNFDKYCQFFFLNTPTSHVLVSLYLHQHRVQSKFWVCADRYVINNISLFLCNSFYYEWVHTFFRSLRIIQTPFSVNCQFMSFTYFLFFSLFKYLLHQRHKPFVWDVFALFVVFFSYMIFLLLCNLIYMSPMASPFWDYKNNFISCFW